ncbi:MAG TPA: ATP-binding protein [Chloroflexota bacterium]|nr:ATP-binding protein [Chloroflexota bacterium]
MRGRRAAVARAASTVFEANGGLVPQALASEEAADRALFAALRVPIVATTLDGRIISFNDAAVALLGSPARLYGRHVCDVLPFVTAPSDPSGAEVQGRLADATGRTLDLEVSRTVLVREASEDLYAVYVVHDISRHAEVNRLREQLLYSVAHELRGPLMVLDNALEILDLDFDHLTAEEFRGVVGTARRTTKRMRMLMEDMLSAGAIQSGHFVVAPRPSRLADIVDEAIDILRPALDRRGQQIVRELPARRLVVMADRRYARQVLTNLLTNASKYSPEHSVIRVRGRPNAKMVRISVEDQGPGIPPEQRAGLFERFYRVRTDTDTPGVGLGLAIAKGIVDAHGGRIGVESEVGSGTQVWFTLPAAGRRHADSARR